MTDLTISSNNANPSLATVNNNLTITITANESLKAANITILGFTYTMSVNGAVASADVTVFKTVQKEMYHSTLQPLILQETTLLQTRRS